MEKVTKPKILKEKRKINKNSNNNNNNNNNSYDIKKIGIIIIKKDWQLGTQHNS